jgi:RalA-binding protein 1
VIYICGSSPSWVRSISLISANLRSFSLLLIRSFIPSDLVDPQERITELSHLIAILPVANYTLLRALTAHLISIVQNANVNKMTMRNVGIVFSPTLGIPAGVFSLMLAEFNRVFNVNDDAYEAESAAVERSALPRVSNASSTDVNQRNSKHYLDATTDQLLGLSGRTLTGTRYHRVALPDRCRFDADMCG